MCKCVLTEEYLRETDIGIIGILSKGGMSKNNITHGRIYRKCNFCLFFFFREGERSLRVFENNHEN